MKRDDASKPSPWQGLHLILIQSIVAILAVGIVLLLRFVGGDVYDDLVRYFRSAMLENTVFAEQYRDVDDLTVESVATTCVTTATTSVQAVFKAEETLIVAPLTGGIITSSYGEREDPFDKTETAVHDGVDIAAPFKTPLAAMIDGVVSEVGYEENGYGHYVSVAYGEGYDYLYAHCSEVNVKAGDSVAAGQTIAHVGSTGRSTGNHVHIEYRCDGEPLDPMLILPEATYA